MRRAIDAVGGSQQREVHESERAELNECSVQ